MGVKREEVFICNILRCRPPNNRTPMPEEAADERVAEEDVGAVRPKFICALGNTPARHLLGLTGGITKMRGRFLRLARHPGHADLPPSAGWDPSKKKEVWEDMKMLLAHGPADSGKGWTTEPV